jgi:hypothetical protein
MITHWEVRPIKAERVVMAFDTEIEALRWLRQRNQRTRQHVPVRLVKVTRTVAEVVETY